MSETDSGKSLLAELTEPHDQAYSPSQYMRARRPELFSDSRVQTESLLGKEVFDYQLGILTSRKHEIDFEHFCRRLAEQELCPNLIAQTGPTGGGDSKVDSETYPVSERIAMRWYQGLPNSSGEERWAFAFSAKREWRSKVRTDIESIVSTNRGYSLIYFITNQYVKDKSRSQVEDQLSGKYRVGVRILDRTWILKCVFEHHREAIAIETLHLDVGAKRSLLVGPRDLARAEQLKATEARIDDTSRYTGVEYQLVEDCLHAAILSRNLERPRVETDGRFSRAERIADRIGIPQQKLRIAYHRAWTAFWWYEDWNDFLRFYDIVEPLAFASTLSDDVELALNLWQLLCTACAQGNLNEATTGLERRRHALYAKLSKLGDDKERPNNALSARTHVAFLEMFTATKDGTTLSPIIKRLKKAISESEGLLDYPVEPFARLVEEIGVLFSEFPEYDELVEKVIAVTQKRAGQEQAGRMLLARGFQKLRSSHIYDSIRFFGRAQQLLALHESREELAQALFGGGLAYEGAGLLWAARANTLASTHIVHAEFHEGGPIPDNALLCARRLVWIELQLGRVAHVLLWIEYASIIAGAQGLDPAQKKKFLAERESQDLALSILLLKAELSDLMELRFLPDVLQRLSLPYARMALLYALGHEDLLRSEGSIPSDDGGESLAATFKALMNQPATSDLPPRPTALEGGTLTYASPVLGCRIVVNAEPDYESQRLGERILAGVEALFSTSLDEQIFPYREELVIDIHKSSSQQGAPTIIDEAFGGDAISVVHGGATSGHGASDGDWFLRILVTVLTKLVMVPEPDDYMNRIFGEESGLARSLNFSESAITMANLLGRDPKTTIPDWNNDYSPKAYIPVRTTTWHGGLYSQAQESVRSELNPGVGEIPEELRRENSKHTQRRVASLIDMPLWNAAKWKGVIYIMSHEMDAEPWMAFGFEDDAAGKSIFERWRARLGSNDKENRLRVSILTGVDRANPHAYSVVVGSNLIEREGVKIFVSVSRVHRMEPSTSANLTGFRNRFERAGAYQLMPGYIDVKNHTYRPYPELAIQKRELRISPAWQIGEHDPDGCGVFESDSPIIPSDVSDPPILKVLQRKRRRR